MIGDFKKLIVARIRLDAPMMTLLKGVGAPAEFVNDPRIYPYYAPNARIDPALQLYGYITYALLSRPRQAGAVNEPTFSLNVWSHGWGTTENISERVWLLFDKKKLTTGTGKVAWSKVVHENDQFQEDTKFAGRPIHVQMGFLNLFVP